MLGRLKRPLPGTSGSRRRKVAFVLEGDGDGFPPYERETVWAEALGGDRYRLENVPFYAKQVAYGDVVRAQDADGVPVFAEVLDASGHSTCRVVVFDEPSTLLERARFDALGCSSELSETPGMFAVDVPAEVDLRSVLETLREGRADDRWDFDVGVDGHGALE